jgi:polyketide cyclase/dehydrase/lipid transport protein
MRIRRRVTIEAPSEMVWDVVTDLRRAHEWAPDFGDFPFVSPAWPKPGSTATWRCRVGPLRFDFHLKLMEAVRGKALQIVNQSIFGEGLEVYSFTMSGSATTVFYDASDQPNFFGRLAAPLFEKKIIALIEGSLTRLKTYCESRDKTARR